ncbi:MAG: hypothetical protein ACI4QL_01360, partial [Candidatus Fimimonas sp.]
MKRNSKIILLILCALVFCLANVFLVACDTNSDGNANGIKDLVDFTDSAVTLEIGDRYEPDITSVADKDGKVYKINDKLFITAQNGAGENVPITNGAFTVADFSGYTVFYRVYEGKNYVERKVTVSVTDTTAPEITLYGVRSEREIGTFDLPKVFVTDNSGESITASKLTVVDANTGANAEGVTLSDTTVTFTKPGTYKFVATAQDSHGNVSTQEKEIVITPSMGANVWENFDNARHLETIKNNNHYTSQTEYKWLESFNGKSGVAEIKPNYKERWFHSAFLQLGFAKTYEEMMACPWDYFTIRAYITAGDETSVAIANGMFVFANYPTGEWVDIVIERKDYLSEDNYNMLSGFNGSESMAERYDAFSNGVTGDVPNLFLSVNTYNH